MCPNCDLIHPSRYNFNSPTKRRDMWHQKKGLIRFECTGCGMCCTGTNDSNYIEVSPDEQEDIRHYLKLSRQWFRRRYLVKIAEEMEGLTITENNHCIFLKNNACSIYPVRPQQCRTYPFWPEIVQSRASWNREKKLCEGIDRGKNLQQNSVRRLIQAAAE